MYSYKTKGVCSREIQFDVENDIIKDVSFEGEACVISISSTNILTNLLIGKTKEEGIY